MIFRRPGGAIPRVPEMFNISWLRYLNFKVFPWHKADQTLRILIEPLADQNILSYTVSKAFDASSATVAVYPAPQSTESPSIPAWIWVRQVNVSIANFPPGIKKPAEAGQLLIKNDVFLIGVTLKYYLAIKSIR